jgi:DNA-binding NtrC family response regulator
MQQNKINILVVDDEILIRDLLFDFFGSRGHMVHLAENGRVAVDMLEEVDFQVALLDLKMPEMDGLEVMAILAEKKPFVPVIIMTAFPSLDSAIESIRTGVFEYIIKPFKIANLAESVIRAAAENQARIKAHYLRCGSPANCDGGADQVSK